MTVANVAFTGNYSHEGLTPTGKVILRRLTVMVILGETIFVIDPPTVAYIDGDGNVAGTLITDDALEAGVIYRVTEEVDGQNVPPVYDIVVIAGMGPIDLTTVARTLSVDAPRSQFEPAGAVAAHNVSDAAHADLRALIAAGTTPDQLAAAIGTYLATHPEGSDDVDVSTFLAGISALFSGSPGYTEAVALLATFGITVPDTPVTLDDFQLMVITWSLGENQNLQEGFALLAFLSAANVFTQGQTIALPADTNMGDTFDVLKTSIAGQMRLRLIAGATGTSYQQGLQLPLYLADDTPVGDSFQLSAADIAGDGSGFVLLAIRIANGSIFFPNEFAPFFIKGFDGNPGFAVTNNDLQAVHDAIPDVSGLQGEIDAKADQTTVAVLSTTVEASQDDLTALAATVETDREGAGGNATPQNNWPEWQSLFKSGRIVVGVFNDLDGLGGTGPDDASIAEGTVIATLPAGFAPRINTPIAVAVTCLGKDTLVSGTISANQNGTVTVGSLPAGTIGISGSGVWATPPPSEE